MLKLMYCEVQLLLEDYRRVCLTPAHPAARTGIRVLDKDNIDKARYIKKRVAFKRIKNKNKAQQENGNIDMKRDHIGLGPFCADLFLCAQPGSREKGCQPYVSAKRLRLRG